jgi:hypothetical protein
MFSSILCLLISPFYKNSGSFVLLQATPLSARDAIYSACAGYALTFCCKNLDRKDILTLSSGIVFLFSHKQFDIFMFNTL